MSVGCPLPPRPIGEMGWGAEASLFCPGPKRHQYREELVPQRGDSPSQEASCQSPKGCQHHFTGCPHHNSSGQSRILDVDLRQHRRVRHWAVSSPLHPASPSPAGAPTTSGRSRTHYPLALCLLHMVSRSDCTKADSPQCLCPYLLPWKTALAGSQTSPPPPMHPSASRRPPPHTMSSRPSPPTRADTAKVLRVLALRE